MDNRNSNRDDINNVFKPSICQFIGSNMIQCDRTLSQNNTKYCNRHKSNEVESNSPNMDNNFGIQNEPVINQN